MFETEAQRTQQVFGDVGRFTVHADGMEAMSCQAEYIFFATGKKQDVAANGELLTTKDVLLGLFSGKQEPGLGERQVELGKSQPLITKDGSFSCGGKLVAFRSCQRLCDSRLLHGSDLRSLADAVFGPELQLMRIKFACGERQIALGRFKAIVNAGKL